MSSASEKSTSSGKQVRKRPLYRKRSQLCDLGPFELRRQVFHALKLQKSSTTSSSAAATASQICDLDPFELRRQVFHALKLHKSSTTASSSATSSHVVVGPQFSSLVESIPLPEPVWSTTAPSVMAPHHAPSSAAASGIMEALEFEWGENQASLYSWWLGFLKTLDGKNAEKSNHTLPVGSHSNWLLGDRRTGLVAAAYQSPSPDEWLMFPTAEDEGENIVTP